MGCLYKLTSPSGKSYIGITLFPLEKRLTEHLRHATKKGTRGPLVSAIKKYGIDAFQCTVLEDHEDWDELCRIERLAIQQHATMSPHGYNMTGGGEGVSDLAPEAKERHRLNTSVATRAAWQRPSMRANRAKAIASSEFKARHAEATSRGTFAAFQDPSIRARLKELRADTTYRAKVSASIKKLWMDPVYRAKQVEKRRARPKRSPESIRAQSEKMRALIADRKRVGTYWSGRFTRAAKESHG